MNANSFFISEDFFASGTRARLYYTQMCRPTCKKYGINQAAFDLLMYLANNPEHNTVRDIHCRQETRSNLISLVVDEMLVYGYLIGYDDSTKNTSVV